MAKTNPAFMNGVPELVVLHLLNTQGPMYGYQLVLAIREHTGQALSFGEGVVYPTLHALERTKCLKSQHDKVNGRPRVYYQITTKGQKKLTQNATRWRELQAAINGLLEGGTSVSPAH